MDQNELRGKKVILYPLKFIGGTNVVVENRRKNDP
jgi:hypothetical protein